MPSTTARKSDFARGYYCAVAVLLREEGLVTPQVRSLFTQGGDPGSADVEDKRLFAEHGLLPRQR